MNRARPRLSLVMVVVLLLLLLLADQPPAYGSSADADNFFGG